MRFLMAVLASLLVSGAASAGSFPGGNGLIAYERQTPTSNVVVTVDPALDTTRELLLGGQPAWSPDGTKLAYVRDETVYVASADGTGAASVGTGDWPSWSPDRTKLAVARYDEVARPESPRGTQQLYVIDLATHAERQLTSGTTDVFLPAWSPDGSRIAYTTPGGLYVLPAQGGAPTQVPTGVWRVYGGPSWSPDGAQLAFIASNGQIVVTAPDGAGTRQVTYTLIGPNSFVGRPAWSPDGTHIAWTQGSDLCVTDLSGNVQRLTHTEQGPQSVFAALPDWQPSAHGETTITSTTGTSSDVAGCDWNPGARVELLDGGPSPLDVSLEAPQELVFVNHTAVPLTVTTDLRGEGATIQPGDYFGFSTESGRYDFTVSGYPDGDRHGTFHVASAARVAFTPRIFTLRYGGRVMLTGTAAGPPSAKVQLWARPRGSGRSFSVGSVKPVDGGWRYAVSPKVTTRYEVSYADAKASTLVYVEPLLRLAHAGRTVTVALRPVPALAHLPVMLVHLRGEAWDGLATARTSARGVAVFRQLRSGWYYVVFAGGGRYGGVKSARFSVPG